MSTCPCQALHSHTEGRHSSMSQEDRAHQKLLCVAPQSWTSGLQGYEKYTSVVYTTQSVVLCHSSWHRLIHPILQIRTQSQGVEASIHEHRACVLITTLYSLFPGGRASLIRPHSQPEDSSIYLWEMRESIWIQSCSMVFKLLEPDFSRDALTDTANIQFAF